MDQTNGCFRLHVFGRVQGVYYRLSTQRKATKLGICGWAHNLSDGSVEVVACGSLSAVKSLEGWCRKGPIGARVDRVLCEEKPWQEITGFEIG